MLAMTASFFLVEIIVGYLTNSIALVADSFLSFADVNGRFYDRKLSLPSDV
jgi:zinc transporter 1